VAQDPSFVPDLDAWDPWHPDEVARALDSLQAVWAVAGGWAIDLHLGRVSRPHSDIEIVLSRSDMHVLRTHLSELEWFAIGEGRAWPIADAPHALHQTWGRDRSKRWRLDVFREPWDAGDWVCRRDPRIRRPLELAIEHTLDGIPYLAPEIVLLFKAEAPQAKDEADLTLTLPLLKPDRISWLRQALRTIHPEHEWLSRLTTV
jgi:aminoglycoside-2''-adenylyltransferase